MAAPRLCVTVTGRTMAELRRRRDEVTDADLVELRVDTVEDPDAAAALAGRRVPVIFTCRSRWEGGHFAGSDDERRRLLTDAQQLGAEYVDVEWKSNFTDLIAARNGRGIVLSMHDFTGVPADLPAQVRAMRNTGAETVKVAVMAERLTDCVSLLPLSDANDNTVLIAMGDAGVITRVQPARFNSAWTYAGDGVAPGQVSAMRLRGEFGFDRLSSKPQLYGVVGRPIMHSLSPAMHNAAFGAASIDAVYLPLAAADFDDFIAFADAFEVIGASVTAPFKRAAYELAHDRDELSQRTEASNTLRRHSQVWQAINTDVAGFVAPLRARGLALNQMRGTILGAGGAARAAAEALTSAGAAVSISARRIDQAEAVARLLNGRIASWPPPPRSWDLLVNATPAGTAPLVDESPLPDGPFDGRWVYDLVYNPPDTRLLRDARRAGCQTIGGLEMLVAQAERQFEWWTGQRPAPGVMQSAVGTLGTSGTVR